MHIKGRSIIIAASAALAAGVISVSVAWACTPSGYGTPASPAAPSGGPDPSGSQAPTAPSAAPTGPSAAGPTAPSTAPSAAPTPATTQSGSVDGGSVSGATGNEPARSRAPQNTAPAVPTPAPAPADPVVAPTDAAGQFAARDEGATAGVTETGGQQVFSSSQARKGGSAGQPASKGRESQVAPSEGTALSDAWSGFGSGTVDSASTAPAATSLGEEGSGSTLGVAILGLGLVGMLGALALAVAPRRRRVKASER